jgi:hypothetical protein
VHDLTNTDIKNEIHTSKVGVGDQVGYRLADWRSYEKRTWSSSERTSTKWIGTVPRVNITRWRNVRLLSVQFHGGSLRKTPFQDAAKKMPIRWSCWNAVKTTWIESEFSGSNLCVCVAGGCVQSCLAGKTVEETAVGKENTRVVEWTRKVILATLAELGRPLNIAAYSLGPHYRDKYFGILNRVSESGFGPIENIFRTPLERADLLKIFTLNRKAWPPRCRAIWAWSGRINLYNRQIMILPRMTDMYATYWGPEKLYRLPPAPSEALILNRFEC